MIPAFSKQSMIFAAIAFFIVVLATATGSLVTTPKILGWYAAINKPWFNPPRLVFPIVWPILFALMAFSFWRILRCVDAGQPRKTAILTFFIQLLFNVAWSFAFFGAESIGAGMVVAAGLALAVLANVLAYRPVDQLAAILQLPYLAWVTFAFILNTAIWWIN
jgi:translocator protein